MRAFAIISALAALCGAIAGPTSASGRELDGPPSSLVERSCTAELCGNPVAAIHEPLKRAHPIPSRTNVYGSLSNAERLARGLPLKGPTRRLSARTGTTSQAPTYTLNGNLRVVNTATNAVMGYVSKNTASTAYFISTQSNALLLSITLPVGSTSGTQLDMTQLNGPNSYPYFGLVQGRDSTNGDLQAGSYNYAYFSATGKTPAGSTPQAVANLPSASIGNSRLSESAIWTVDVVAGTVSATWINSNGLPADTKLFSQSNAVYAGGDQTAFASRYPSPVTTYRYEWVTV